MLADQNANKVELYDEGLRCQDVYAGLRNIDPSSPTLVPLSETRRVGMAAGLAALIRGRDVIDDAQNLRVIAAEQLDIGALEFNSVIETLEDGGLVADVVRNGNRIESFSEIVPFYGDLYNRLGESWRGARPTELEQQVVLLTDRLAHAPIAMDDVVDSVGLDSSELQAVLEVSDHSNLIKTVDLDGDKVLYSPFLGFENPQALADVVREHGSYQLADAFDAIRGEQGMPVSLVSEVVADAVSRGLLQAPSVQKPDGAFEAFATLPYSIDPAVLRGRKPVMEKALAVIACLRTGQFFGGFSNLSRPALIHAINKLLEVGYLLPHSSHERQYRLLNRAGVIQLAPDLRPNGAWRTPTLIDSEDNRAALVLARDLLTYGEPMAGRAPTNASIGHLLDSGGPYGTPMKTVARYRDKRYLKDKSWQSAINKLMGHSAA